MLLKIYRLLNFLMIRRIFTAFISFLLLIVCNPAYSKEVSQKSLEKYIGKISTKFSKTYCNTVNFGISDEGAILFAIGETNKEFKNNQLNKLIDYSFLKESIVNSLGSSCQVYGFPIDNLDKLNLG